VIQCPNTLQTPAAGNQSVQRTQGAQDPLQADHRCYNYGDKGDYANRCPNPRTRANQTTTATPLVEPTLSRLLPSRTMLMGESTMLLWRKPKKLRMWSLVCFSSTTLLHLCFFILEHRILLYPLYMLRSIIYPWPC
jgi:hypothetical protein